MIEQLNISQALIRGFESMGIKDAFIVTGGAIAEITEALANSQMIRCHYMLTEQSAAIAAEAYGHYDGNPALVIVTSGPGATNAITGVAAGWTNSSPMIVISGQARTIDVKLQNEKINRQWGNQHLETRNIVKTFTKKVVEPLEIFDGYKLAQDLVSEAVASRMGPVWLSIPSDLQRMPDSPSVSFHIADSGEMQTLENPNELSEIIHAKFSEARRPLALLGNGCRLDPETMKKFENYAARNGIALLTTWTGLDLIVDDAETFFGRPGTIPSSRVSNMAIQECDFLLILGARLDLAQVGFQPNSFAIQSNVIRIDIDESEFLRIPKRENWTNYLANAAAVISHIVESSSIDNNDHCEWIERLQKLKQLPSGRSSISDNYSLSTYQAVQALDSFEFPNVVLGSSGTCVEMVLQSWRISRNQRFLNSGGLGSMGFALAGGIGVHLKSDACTLVIESDGSLAMNIQDLQTISSNRYNIKIVILDSCGYKSIRLSQNRQSQKFHGTDRSNGLFLPSANTWAKAAGLETRTVSHEDYLLDGIEWMLENDSPRLLQVMVSDLEEALPRLVSKPNSQGRMETAPFTELWPKID